MTDKMLGEIETFFRGYAEAVDDRDFNRVAALHHAPCFKTHGGSDAIDCLQSHDAVRDFFRDLFGRYKTRGLRAGSFSDLKVTPMGAKAALATLAWTQTGEDGVVVREFPRSYAMIQQEGAWLILAAIGHRPPDDAGAGG